MTGREFRTGYKRDRVVARVALPVVLGVFFVAVGVLEAAPALAIPSAIAFVIALHNWPLVDPERAAFHLSDHGLYVDGLGHVDWEDVTKIRSGRVAVNNVAIPALDVVFRDIIPKVFRREGPHKVYGWQLRPFAFRLDGSIRVKLSMLTDDPDDVINAFKYFLDRV